MRSIEELRRDTPGAAGVTHLNNAGSSLMPSSVADAIRDHLDLELRIGGYEAADRIRDRVRACYDDLAAVVGAESHQIALTEHATQSFVQALSSIPLSAGDAILTTDQDYNSNQIQYLSLAERLGVRVERAPTLDSGEVDTAATRDLIHRTRPRVVAMTQIPTNSGMVQDLTGIGAATRAAGGWFIVDACQSVGQIPVDVRELECDFLSSTARKYLRGPRGAGFLYVSDRALDAELVPLFPDLRGSDWIDADLTQPAPDARRFESWEFAWALVLGMGAAARYLLDEGVEETTSRACALGASLRERISEVPGVRVMDRGARMAAIVSVAVDGHDPGDLMSALRERGIHTTAQDRVSATIDYDRKGIEGTLRLSPHYFNTEEELQNAVDALRELVRS